MNQDVQIVPNLPEEKYHSQELFKTPRLTYSTAKTIIHKSPYHAWLEHPLLGGKGKTATRAMDKGSIIHSMLLGGGPEIIWIDAEDYRTKAAKEQRDEAREAGKIPMLSKELDEINLIVDRVETQLKEQAPYFFEPHESELSVRYEIDGVKCQSRWDWISQEAGKQIDIKTTNDANPEKLSRKILDFGYDIQEAMYTYAATKAWPEMAGRWTWEFIFIETEPPYLISIIETDGAMKWIGERKLFRAVETWRRCLESDNWPGYGRAIATAPAWAVNKEEEE